MESRDIQVQQSRLSIITWSSFTIAIIYFFNCLVGLTSTSLAKQLLTIQNNAQPSQNLDTFVQQIVKIQFQENIINTIGLICAILFIISVIAIHLKKTWGAKLYSGAIFSALIYNLVNIYFIYAQNNIKLPSTVNELHSEEVSILHILETVFSSINFGTGLIFFIIALSYLTINILFFQNAKTKYILKHP